MTKYVKGPRTYPAGRKPPVRRTTLIDLEQHGYALAQERERAEERLRQIETESSALILAMAMLDAQDEVIT